MRKENTKISNDYLMYLSLMSYSKETLRNAVDNYPLNKFK